jgi:hypothetical protein
MALKPTSRSTEGRLTVYLGNCQELLPELASHPRVGDYTLMWIVESGGPLCQIPVRGLLEPL